MAALAVIDMCGDHQCSEKQMHAASKGTVPVKVLLESRAKLSGDLECAKWLANDFVAYKECNEDTLRRTIGLCAQKVKKMKKNKSKELNSYLESEFKAPESDISKIKDEHTNDIANKIASQTKAVVLENRALKRANAELTEDCNQLENEIVCIREQFQVAVGVLEKASNDYHRLVKEKSLKNELERSNKEYQKKADEVLLLSKKLETAEKRLTKVNTRNVNKKLKRRGLNISDLKEKVSEMEVENQILREQIQDNNFDEKKCKKEKLQLQKTVSKLKGQVRNLKESIENQKENLDMNEFLCFQTQTENEKKIAELESIINLLETDTVQTFYEGRYSDEVRECCMALISECNVSMNKLPLIINTVLQTFTGKMAERLPSKTLLSWLMAEAKVVASKHIATEMLQGVDYTSNTGNVLHQDATTKFHRHYEGAQVTLRDGKSLTIGLHEVAGGDGKTYIETFKDMVSDLAECLGGEVEESKAKLICSIKSLMSDQCATNGVFNEGVEELRKTLIPAVVENFANMSDSEKALISDMGKFSCRLHLLANFGTESDKALNNFESSVAEGRNPHSFDGSESGAFRLLRTSAKAFTQRGSDKSGVNSYWETFLNGRNKKNELVTFHGHRINIAFHDGAALYYHRRDISDFLDNWPDPNGLLRSIHFDIKEPAYIAGARAMGIFDKLVTAPFWRLLEMPGSILDINEDLLQMQTTLYHWSQDGSLPFSQELMFPEQRVSVSKDKLFDELFSATEDENLDALTVMALELLSAQLLILLERQAKSQLPEGKYWNPSENLKEMASNVPKTNVISERDMAMLDNLLRIKPAASSLTIEAVVMCTKNKPFEWLRSLNDDERTKILEQARKLAPSIRKKFAERKEMLKQRLKQKLDEKKKKVEQKEIKDSTQKVTLSRKISQYGGPWTRDEVDGKIQSLSQNEVKDAILTQIKFHKFVLRSKGPRELFQESAKKIKFSTEILTQNLKTILDLNGIIPEEDESNGLVYKSLDESKNALKTRKLN